jgi:two-component system NarL family response regulator
MALRVLVADDEADIRLLLRLRLGLCDEFELVGEAADGLGAAQQAAEQHPDVVVLDWRMPGLSGLEAIPLIRRASPGSHILMYTSRPSRQADEEALAVGADGYLEKTAGTDALVAAIKQVAARGNGHNR